MNRILLDTNLLVLLVVGLTDRSLIERHKRTKSFEPADFDLLAKVLSNYEMIVVTPHILAEASNLSSQIGDPALSSVRATFARLIEVQDERSVSSKSAVQHSSYLRLGLTDAAILGVVGSSMPLLTTDLDLYLAAAATNQGATNFNHLREARLLGI